MYNQYQNETVREVYDKTSILRKPISGIVSGYHQLSYILIAPDQKNPSNCTEVRGKINVSPKFIITPSMLQETFGDVFDSETFDKEIEGRLFSFSYSKKHQLKISNESFSMNSFEENFKDHLERVQDELMQQEDTRTGLISCPNFNYYPVSIDRFISEIIDREF